MKYQKVRGYGTSNKKVTLKDTLSVLGLCLACVAAVGITFFVTGLKDDEVKKSTNISSVTEDLQDDIEEISVETHEKVEEDSSQNVIAEEAVEESETVETVNEDEIYETESVIMTNTPALEFVPPLKGKILKGYSSTALVYSKTLEDWRLHTGLDIGAKIGTTVLSCADGVVEYAGKDVRYGYTIIISHGDNLKSVYSNLTGTDMVRVGKDLKKGDPIGMVGDSAICETADEAHLHFEMKLNEICVNPLDYFEL